LRKKLPTLITTAAIIGVKMCVNIKTVPLQALGVAGA